eukprot:TRINITY_DN9132_c0_g1_i3.p1 TRINITY_DN9132_c0_g1~~TRINITY_DN9132_c0_g1_i3.p1  ORF type:complete len:287 (-),score=78.40 TRINITY_DN9132_c0_g1_i3:325-1185(-)
MQPQDLKHQKALFTELQKTASSHQALKWTERQRQQFEADLLKRQREYQRSKEEIRKAELELRNLQLFQQDQIRVAALAKKAEEENAKKEAVANQSSRLDSMLDKSLGPKISAKEAAIIAEKEKKYSAAVFESFAEASEKHNKDMLDFENQLLAQMQSVKIRKAKVAEEEMSRQKEIQTVTKKPPSVPRRAVSVDRKPIARPPSGSLRRSPSPSLPQAPVASSAPKSGHASEASAGLSVVDDVERTNSSIRSTKLESKIAQERARLNQELSLLQSKTTSRTRSISNS